MSEKFIDPAHSILATTFKIVAKVFDCDVDLREMKRLGGGPAKGAIRLTLDIYVDDILEDELLKLRDIGAETVYDKIKPVLLNPDK